jgi:uncharacterized OB-fold protein
MRSVPKRRKDSMVKKKIKMKKKAQPKKKAQAKKKPQAKKSKEVKFIGNVTHIRQTKPATVIEWPRSITHIHTYGMLSPFFEGLRKGELRATQCPSENCTENRLWIPPRAHCPDCHTEMVWKTLPNPVIGTIYTYTQVVYSGIGTELSTPYWQVDVEIPGLATIPKSYLLYGEPCIGMKVKAGFRTKNPTNTVLDYYWVPYEA